MRHAPPSDGAALQIHLPAKPLARRRGRMLRLFALYRRPDRVQASVYDYADGKLKPVEDALTVDGLVTGMRVKGYKHPKKARRGLRM